MASLIDGTVRDALNLVFREIEPTIAVSEKRKNSALLPHELDSLASSELTAVLVKFDLGWIDSDVTVACSAVDESATVRVRFLSTIGRRSSVSAKLAAALDELVKLERRTAVMQACLDEAIALEWPGVDKDSFRFLPIAPYQYTNTSTYAAYVPIVAYALLRKLRVLYKQRAALPACVASIPITPAPVSE